VASGGRPTVEIVVLIFATTLSLVILGSVVAVLAVEVVRPEVETRRVVEAIANTLQVLLGAVLGYIVRGTREAYPATRGDTGPVHPARREDTAMSTDTPDRQPDATEPPTTPQPDPGVVPDQPGAPDEDTQPDPSRRR
jgi:hypothetical protein